MESLQKTQTEATRIEALVPVTKLQRSLEKPKDALLKLSYQPTVFMALKVAHDMRIFPLLANAASPVSAKELATAKPADSLLVERIMRLLVSFDVVNEPKPGAYLPTAVSKQMVKRPVIGAVESLSCEFLPILIKPPRISRCHQLRQPGRPRPLPAPVHPQCLAGRLHLALREPDALARFNDFMEGHRGSRTNWADWFPVRKRILDGADPGRPLLVDISGGRGHDLMLFQERFPDAPGKLVLQDLPTVIDEAAPELNARGIQGVKYDFFKDPNPVQGAHYLKFIFHDWSDDKARVLLNHVVSAMEAGCSKVVIEEYILPDQNAQFLHGTTDMAVMIFCAGLERTRAQWRTLLGSVGLQPTAWTREDEGLGVIEAVLPV
ncbi:S-adenosyl-L-methionine-dependent methyltransferase [Aspergillus aurantiobrunneus]